MPSLSLGVIIRFSDSSATLPAVLAALKQQTLQPDILLGVNSGGTDRSPDLIRAAGGTVADWTQPYAHAAVLNFGIRLLHTDLVLVLSSHTVLESPDTLAQMVAAMQDPAVACASAKWDDDPFYSDTVTWDELKAKGLRFGAIYSNSMGMIRRALWERFPFDESLPTSEDYEWAVRALSEGYSCRRLAFDFSYQRSGTSRDREFASVVFHIARRHRLRVTWLGVIGSIKLILRQSISPTLPAARKEDLAPVRARLRAWWGAVLCRFCHGG